MKKILVATTNTGKLAELSAMLEDTQKHQVHWLGLKDFPDIPEVIEDGRSFEENARKKACGYAKATGLWTIADDSGLVIDALDGAPGVESARFSGQKSAPRSLLDHLNMQKVLSLMKDIPAPRRTARFVCALCLAAPSGVLAETMGTLEGNITHQEAGINGFGYDPIFFVPAINRTAAQLADKEKNAISHRGNAIRKLKPLLAELLKNKVR